MTLEISQRDQAALKRGADRFTTIGCIELPEYVVKVRFDRRRGQGKVLSHALCGLAFGYSSEDLHFPGRQGCHVVLR